MAIERRLLGKAIRKVRQLRGLSQVALAGQAGLRGNSLALIERGQRGVSLESLNALADALDVPAACLTVLGTSKIAGDRSSTTLVRKLQKLIVATVSAQVELDARDKGESKRKRTSRTASRKLETV
jgi:transcriptional regulator with XRE-family HTH domain